jgi:predicted ATPase/signal transduction histidine kinase
VIDLSSYIFEVLRKDDDFILYRGQDRSDGSQVLALSPVKEPPELQALKRIKQELSLKPDLDPEWAIRTIGIARHWGRRVLVLEDPGGVPLDQLLGHPLEVAFALRVAINLATAIGRLHQRGVIHKDIKPANALINSVTAQCWLMGFGFTSRLPRERQALEPPEFVDGTLAYMAPEQTGRMNRSIDSRSDLYALGVTLYEMLTGVLPFSASDPLGWVHCHIARQPTPPVGRVHSLPLPISAVVMKLLSKTAEERYQTATGLERDLRRCLAEWEARGQIPEFYLGEHDTPDQLLIPEKLYGRSQEIQELLAAFHRVVAEGRPELMLVSGSAGIGKSSVVSELHRVLVPARGLFAWGKFDQHKRDIPYTTLAKAFQTLIQQILAKSDTELTHWRYELREALGSSGQIIVNLIPELELVIGEQPPVSDLPPQDAQNRFKIVFRRFLDVFARAEHPLVLFLDDLQWLDSATLELLKHLFTEADVRYLLFLGAYRDNEVSSSHPAAQMLAEVQQSGIAVQIMVLEPLTTVDLLQLIVDTLQCDAGDAEPLAQLLQQKTGGNPLFVVQFLTALAEDGFLVFDSNSRRWLWNLQSIRAKGFTDNVVDLMTEKLGRLPGVTREALQQLACLGNSAGIATLKTIRGESEDRLHAVLWEAVRAGLVTRLDGGYGFTHDRVQEVAHALIDEQKRPQLHLRIGRLLVKNLAQDEIELNLFDIVNQLNSGSALVSELDEKERIAELNLRAGRKAKTSAAYASACIYLSAGMALAGHDVWQRRYELAFSLWLERAESEFLAGNFDGADVFISELLDRSRSAVDKVAAHRLRILLHLMRGEFGKAVEHGLECLRLFEIEVPAHPTREMVQAEYERIYQQLADRPIESLAELPLMTNPEMQAITGILSVMAAPAFNTDINLMYLCFCRIVNATLEYGTADTSAHGYAEFATLLGPVFHRYADGNRFGKLACVLTERHGFNRYKTKVYFCMQRAMLWTQPIQSAIDFIRRAIDSATETHDTAFTCFGWNHLIAALLFQGVPLDEVGRESRNGIDFVRKVKMRDEDAILQFQKRMILTLRGERPISSRGADTCFTDQFVESEFETRKPFTAFYYWTAKVQLSFIFLDYDTAVGAARRAKALLWTTDQHILSADYYFYTALTAAALYEQATSNNRSEMIEIMNQSLERLREWAEGCPGTFLDRYLLLSAELARIEGQGMDAMRLYEEAIRAAHENGFVQNEALSNELAARFCLNRKLEKAAHSYFRGSRSCYLRWGALGKVRQLDGTNPTPPEPSLPAPASAISTSVERLDLGTVFKAAQAVSSEIVTEKLIETLLIIALEQAGAERGLMISPRGLEQEIEAEAKSVGDKVTVHFQQSLVTPAALPLSLLRQVIRTQERVLLSDASTENRFSADEYFVEKHPRSVLCLPLVKQRELIGVLYLENSLAPDVFAPNGLAALELIAAQAAISLQQARLYAELSHANEELKDEITERKRAEAELHQKEISLREAQAELAHFSRLTTMGELAASIVHEINQPLAGIVTNANAGLRWLTGGEPNLAETREAIGRIIRDGRRGAEIISRIRALAKKAPPNKDRLNLNETIIEVIAIAHTEVQRNQVLLQSELANDLPPILGDRIQLQQVILNLLMNGIEAMSGLVDSRRELTVSSEKVTAIDGAERHEIDEVHDLIKARPNQVLITVRDSGPGLEPHGIKHLFDAFYTTKPQGLGMGLAISRSIIEAHGGRLWAIATASGGVFQFALPIPDEHDT